MAEAAKLNPGGSTLRANIDVDEGTEAALRNQLDAQQARQVVYAVDGAIDPTISHTAIITKGSAAAMTLAAPATTDNGTRIVIQAGSAFAHVVTATGLIQDGVTGGAKNTYTTAAFVGSGATLEAYNGKWHLLSKNLGTVA
jgi:hypothetical protein